MTTSRGENFGVAKLNEMIEIGRFESQGPANVTVRNMSDTADAVIRVEKAVSARTTVATDKDTARSAEDTGYTGNGSTLAFSAQVLNNRPVVPRTVQIRDVADVYHLYDKGDGILYTDDVDDEVAGFINYFTGALTLAYPAGKAPDSGNMTANYNSQDSVLNSRGLKTFNIASVQQDEELVVYAAGDAEAGTRCRCEMISNWE